MKVFITSIHNKPAGGTKVLNQMVNLCLEKGIEAYLVIPDKTEEAWWLTEKAPTCDYEDMKKWCAPEDVVIDCWQSKISWDTIHQVPAQRKVFWQHGASIPTGGNCVGDVAYKAGTPYTAFWNVSTACATYLQKKYALPRVDLLHPFFDSDTLLAHQDMEPAERDGFLVLARRGSAYIPDVERVLSQKARLTILEQPFTEDVLYAALKEHTFYISVDDGVHARSPRAHLKHAVKMALKKEYRQKQMQQNTGWIVPEGHLLGFPMPPVEAAWLGAVTIGFAMGGGREWMNQKNCFLAEDGNARSLEMQIAAALQADASTIADKAARAKEDTARFSKEQTWTQLSSLLSLSV